MRYLFAATAVFAGAFALSACSDAAETAEGAPAASGSSVDGPDMEAGKWTSTMSIQKFEIPGAPPEMAKMMDGIIGRENVTENCVTEEEAKEGWANRMDEFSGNDNCTASDFSADDGKLSGAVSCKESNGTVANMTIEGAYTSTSVEMNMNAEIEGPDMPGGKGVMAMKVESKRIGDCDEA